MAIGSFGERGYRDAPSVSDAQREASDLGANPARMRSVITRRPERCRTGRQTEERAARDAVGVAEASRDERAEWADGRPSRPGQNNEECLMGKRFDFVTDCRFLKKKCFFRNSR